MGKIGFGIMAAFALALGFAFAFAFAFGAAASGRAEGTGFTDSSLAATLAEAARDSARAFACFGAGGSEA